jgi:hypothetical protein
MSGGHFYYDQYKILHIADSIESFIYDDSDGPRYSPETIAEFKIAVEKLNEAFVYAQRIDWLLSGDDGEDTFHKRLKEDLTKAKGE